jgi:hypothetical protein
MEKLGNGDFGTPGPGFSVVNKFGENSDIDVLDAPIEIWAHGADGTNFPFLDAGVAMDFKSSDANDTLLGSGAQKLRFTYYKTDNTEAVIEKDLDGLNPVQLDDDVKMCTRIEVIQAGAGKTNAGEINLVDRATGLIVYQSVEIGEGQTLSAIQICPKGKKCKVVFHYATYSRALAAFNSAQMRLRLRKVGGALLTKYNTTISSNHPRDERTYAKGGIELVEGEIIFWECKAVSGNDTPIEAGFDLETEDV